MVQTLLTPTAVTREALRILHQKLNFVGSINRQYDDQFAKKGAKIGDTLNIRMPNQYKIRRGKTIDTQDTQEDSVQLKVNNQIGVDTNFSSVDLTLSLDDFSKRILDPAMAVLAANIEGDAMNMYKDVYNAVWPTGPASLAYNDVLTGRTLMQRDLAPINDRTANLNSTDMPNLVKDTKTLFNDQGQVGKQYREGYMGRAAGYDFVENTLWAGHNRGAANTSYVVNTSTGIVDGSNSIAVTAGSGALNKGDIITIAGVNKVHPETKTDYGVLQQFVVTADYAGGAGSITVSPTPITSGAKQNVVINSAGSGKAVVVAGANGLYGTSLLYQEDAFTFATADLVMPSGVDFARREVMDGISMRIVRQYDINNDNFPCRIDVLYGYKSLRPGWATRLHYT